MLQALCIVPHTQTVVMSTVWFLMIIIGCCYLTSTQTPDHVYNGDAVRVCVCVKIQPILRLCTTIVAESISQFMQTVVAHSSVLVQIR